MFSEVWVDVWKIEVKGVLFICFIKSLFKSIPHYIYIHTHTHLILTSTWFQSKLTGIHSRKKTLDSSSGIPDWHLSHLWKIKKHEATCDHILVYHLFRNCFRIYVLQLLLGAWFFVGPLMFQTIKREERGTLWEV
jgi:hypothetical protein